MERLRSSLEIKNFRQNIETLQQPWISAEALFISLASDPINIRTFTFDATRQPGDHSVLSAVELMAVMSLRQIFRIQNKSLVRGTVLSLSSLWISFQISGFPLVHICLWLLVPLLVTCLAVWDTTRCLQKRWNFYHGAVLLLIYVDLMILLMIAFLLLAPFSSLVL